MKKIILCLLWAPLCMTAAAQDKKGNSNPDMKFVQEAAMGGMMEVTLGRIAQTRGNSQQVKELGRMMVEDHSRANQELMALAKKKNWTTPATLGPAMQEATERLARLKGDEFDRAYIQEMEKDHRKDIREFQTEAERGTDADLKSWAGGKVPVLQSHLEHVMSAARSLNMGGKGNGDMQHADHPGKQ